MNISELSKDAYEIYKTLYPFIQKYGYSAFEVLKVLVQSNLHPDKITNQDIENATQGVVKANQEIQNA